ncbi:helix-turn-helix domain-containing protein [Streptomyces phytophilus]|uniref:helix-turn-helix domain-containing protein n=1 Tax=Streptomyces phytophilus TaxID=722715 RepID=UPI0015F03B0F|nr:helix-turn-helix transcriptional regulator [Streptomyces phytophilus]
MAKDWKRLGLAVKHARDDRGMTQADLAEATGQDASTIQNLETGRFGKGFSRVPSSARLVAAYFGWTDDSPRRILDGGDPVPLNPPSPTRPEAAAPAEGGEPVFRDPRYQAIIDSALPYEERAQMIRDLVEAALARAREQEDSIARDAG